MMKLKGTSQEFIEILCDIFFCKNAVGNIEIRSELFVDRLLGGFLKIFAEILLEGFLKIFAEILLEGFLNIFSEIL